mgnify:CR=1 FL=1
MPPPHEAWKAAPIVWLTGVRRAGKTVLARGVGDSEYLNCDLPSTARRLEDPEMFFQSLTAQRVVLDEVHQLPDPSHLLKIAADAFPRLRVLATGSSTLAATKKFRDSLAGRKRVLRLVPVLHSEHEAFGASLDRRLLHGGLPPALLSAELPSGFFSEWLDSYFARDVQDLFHVEKRAHFLRLVELVLHQSGGQWDVAKMAAATGVSRPTVMNWMEVLGVTHVAHMIRPFSGRGRREITGQPRVYAFDTGFVCHARGWDSLRTEDRGGLWEHLVLDELLTRVEAPIQYWRDKQGREMDFVIARGREAADAIECKWNPDAFEPRGLLAFREHYPKGRNFLCCPGVKTAARW